jgi:hypothetical protein
VVRAEFFPENPDRLYKYFGKLSKSRRAILLRLAVSFFDVLRLMTPQERFILLKCFLKISTEPPTF